MCFWEFFTECVVFLQSLSSHWNHDGDPTELVRVNQLVEKFRKQLADNPRFLQDKVQQYLRVSGLVQLGLDGLFLGIYFSIFDRQWGVGIAQWIEHLTHD